MDSPINDIILFKSTSLLSSAFTMDTTSDMTVTGHGYSLDDKIRVSSDDTLPAGLSADTDYYVVAIVGANTVKISATMGGAAITTTDAGTGTHTVVLKSRKVLTKGFNIINLSWGTANNANFTVKIQISDQDDVDFEAAASATNRWTYVQNIKNDDGVPFDGSTGITQDVPGTDENKRFDINVDHAVWVCADVTAWTAGTLDLRATLAN